MDKSQEYYEGRYDGIVKCCSVMRALLNNAINKKDVEVKFLIANAASIIADLAEETELTINNYNRKEN